jgi:cobalamin biosynthesis protein CbiG
MFGKRKPKMKRFEIYWLNGYWRRVEGYSIEDALRREGIAPSAIEAIASH